MIQALWVLIGLGPFLAFATYMILSGRSRQAAERRVWATRMPRWAIMTDVVVRVTLWLVLAMVAYKGFSDLHRVAHGDAGTSHPGALADALMLFSGLTGALGPAYLAAALIGRLIPPLHRANRAAEAGLATLGFGRAVLGLLGLSALLIPTALAQGILGALEPWAR